ncbi:cell division cycle-associated protein 2 isoform X1 [Falco cherrug]|uniref:cell division cycle-associated protein 2 isoform X1 n=1 Tax=Falco cherrug TaxID=345164 RepID=UPI00247ABF0B|nr:cell division cycle-associated protein 2 isoform X1 [Falco cherrug]XP_055552043.1 cell division cycle-associated protein 2 isoform X1 [Falco cherrug]XP_055552044.1 cell division cycle-associated protein 2 isoform X1 [Falco cherrug]XP_055552045.1 cell division cycle-associated protein 2 isoform X1 [Falco cherrug]XP_055552046.1 cell division cycle-associated protein 2 isoform X1 [Falco cherrug]XP_055552047.1 cell division cycle-associated protein 2 isoform X1 [Falco cherrug]
MFLKSLTMHRQSKNVKVPLKVRKNESTCTAEKVEASFPDLSEDQKVCTVTKLKVVKASTKENLSDGVQAQLQRYIPKYTKGLLKESYHREDASCQITESFFDTPKGDMVGDSTLPVNSEEKFSSTPVSLEGECYLTPNRDKAEEKPDCGISEKPKKKSVDFATVTIAEFGISQESFTEPSIGKSSTLKFRRRSSIGVRGSPENNSLIQFLAQQRSNRQNEAFTQQDRHGNIRSLKDKIDSFSTFFKSIEEAEVDGASQEAGSSQIKVPFTKERNVDRWSGKFTSDCNGADLKDSLRQNLIHSSKSDLKICTILSSGQGVTVTEPAAAVSKEWVYEQHSPTDSLETVLIRGTLETGHDFSSDHVTRDSSSSVISDLRGKQVNFAELSLEILDESKSPVTPLRTGESSLGGHALRGSHLQSVLKKMPTKPLMDSMKEHSNDAVAGGGGESLAVSNCAEIFESLQTEEAERHSSEKPSKKRKVTFGEVLSPEIFDETLPANTPLRKGAMPGHHPRLNSHSLVVVSSLIEEPLTQPNFDCDDECVEPLQELLEGSVAAGDVLPVENAEAETDKSDMRKTSRKRKCGPISKGTDVSISTSINTNNAKDTKNPRKNKFQRQKDITISAAKKTQKRKHTSYGKRRKKKVEEKPLYMEREMASKKPLLSPIPEIPEACSFASSPKSPKAKEFFSEAVFLDNAQSGKACKDVRQEPVVEEMRGKNICAVHTNPSFKDMDTAEASSSHDTAFQVSGGDLESASATGHKLSNIVPDVKCSFDTSDCFQQVKETACVEEEKESSSLIENEKLQGNLLNKAEQLTGLEFLEQQGTGVHEGAQGARCPREDSVRDNPPRGRSSSTINFPPVEKLEITGNDLLVSSFNVEEFLSAPRLENDSLEPSRRKNSNSAEKRVKRSMRLCKGADTEGLAWIQVPSEVQENLLASASDLLVSSFNVEEFLCAPRLENDSLEPSRRKNNNSAEKRVKRSMRLCKGADTEGLAWIQVPSEVQKNLLASASKLRRSSTSILMESENIHHKQQNLTQFSAPGKENNDSGNLAGSPYRRCRRRNMCVSTPQETRTWSQTRKRSITNSVARKDRCNHEEIEVPLENNSNV